MKSVWKFPLEITDEQAIDIPIEYIILSVHTQYGKPYLWVLVDPDNITTKCIIKMYGTGHPIDTIEGFELNFVGTFLVHSDSLVFHVFEERF